MAPRYKLKMLHGNDKLSFENIGGPDFPIRIWGFYETRSSTYRKDGDDEAQFREAEKSQIVIR